MADAVLDLPKYEERVLFMGSNGSGKSVLAGAMLAAGGYDYVALDLKGDFAPPGQEIVVIRRPDDPRWRVGYRHIVYRPDPDHANGKSLDAFLRRLYLRAQKSGRRHPFVVYVDEALALAQTGHTQWLQALAVSGRSLGVGLWAASQRPRVIPVSIRSEAWRWYVFFLTYREDEEEVVRYAKGQVTIEDLERATASHAFIELKRGEGGRVLVRRWPPLRLPETG
jgi:hypothetical protein